LSLDLDRPEPTESHIHHNSLPRGNPTLRKLRPLPVRRKPVRATVPTTPTVPLPRRGTDGFSICRSGGRLDAAGETASIRKSIDRWGFVVQGSTVLHGELVAWFALCTIMQGY
jgi:hypothetical protein